MFIFVEGCDGLKFDLGPDIQQVKINVGERLSFPVAIQMLALYSKPIDARAIVFHNFFSVGCSKLMTSHCRGLERIALGENSIEITDYQTPKTRFLLKMSGENIQKQIGTLRAMVHDRQSFGIGNYSPGNTLLVGERPGPDSYGYDTPFVGSNSGLWLLRQLEMQNVDESCLYWINAINAKGIPAEPDFIEFLKPKRIITLGNVAKVWAADLKTDHTVVNLYHPQYWRRFQSHTKYPLLDYLPKI